MRKYWIGLAVGVAAMATVSLAAAQDKVPLPQEAHINDELIAGAAGDVLRNTCPAISARMLVVMGKLLDLKSYAEGKGYTEAEVKLFLKDPVQKARVKAAAADYLHNAGAVDGNADSFCQVGRDEIAKGTLLGSLIRIE